MQRKKMFLVVCISALLAGAVQGQNFLPAKGKFIPEHLEWRREIFFPPKVPGRDLSDRWKTAEGTLLPDQGMRIKIIPANRVVMHFGFFCRRELELEKTIRLPLRFRLGSLEYCNRLEGK